MKPSKRRRRKLPKIEHQREEIHPRDERGIAKILLEVRGVRSTSRSVSHDGTIIRNISEKSALEENSSDEDELALFRGANQLLVEAKELGYVDIVSREHSEKATLQKLEKWASDLALRHGFLSPLSIAAEYLVSKLYLARASTGQSTAPWSAIVRFCQAYHWLHFELSGLHSMAAGSEREARSRAIGPFAISERATAAREIVRQEYHAFCKQEHRRTYRANATYVAAAILAAVNRSLKANKLPTFTEGSLRKLLGKFIFQD